MIEAQAIEYITSVPEDTGASEPIVISIKPDVNGQIFDAYAKLSIKLPLGIRAYVIEAISSFLANDLGIYTPDPIIVNFSEDFIESVHEPKVKERLKQSSKVAFATKKLPKGFSDVSQNDFPLSGDMLQQAARIFAFDAAIENVDRGGEGKSNCMTDGSCLAAIDHEKSFLHLIGAKKPWQLGGLDHYKTPNSHIFINELVKNSSKTDLEDFIQAWKRITDDRITSYGNAIPPIWIEDPQILARILLHIRQVRDNIDGLITEIYRIWDKL